MLSMVITRFCWENLTNKNNNQLRFILLKIKKNESNKTSLSLWNNDNYGRSCLILLKGKFSHSFRSYKRDIRDYPST